MPRPCDFSPAEITLRFHGSSSSSSSSSSWGDGDSRSSTTTSSPTTTSTTTTQKIGGKYRRSFAGCDTCRAHRKKCDEAKPACSTCVRRGRPCVYRPRTVRIFASASCSHPKPPPVRRSQLPQSVQMDIGAAAVALVLSGHPSVLYGGGSKGLPGPLASFWQLQHMSPGSPLHTMAEAYSLLLLSRRQVDASMFQAAIKAYSRSICAIAPLLTPQACAVSLEALCTTSLMAYFELMMPVESIPSDYTNHLKGLKLLLENLSPALINDQANADILLVCRRQVLMPYIILEDPALCRAPNGVWDVANVYNSGSSDNFLDTMVTDAVRVHADVEHFLRSCPGPVPSRRAEARTLVSRAHAALRSYALFQETFDHGSLSVQDDSWAHTEPTPTPPESAHLWPGAPVWHGHPADAMRQIAGHLWRLVALASVFKLSRWLYDDDDDDASAGLAGADKEKLAVQMHECWDQCADAVRWLAACVPPLTPHTKQSAPAAEASVSSTLPQQEPQLPRIFDIYIASALLTVCRVESVSPAQVRWFEYKLGHFSLAPIQRQLSDKKSRKGLLTGQILDR